MTRFQPWWQDNAESTGYRIHDTHNNIDIGFISCMAGKQNFARKDQTNAYRIATAQCDKLNDEVTARIGKGVA